MTKILNAAQIRELDQFTIQQEGIHSIDLMERACRAFTIWFTERFHALHKVGVVCGPGNNGGDGLGVARMLKEWGYPVKVWIVKGSVDNSPDFKINLTRLLETQAQVYEISSDADQNLFSDRDVLIDALFGSGLSRPIEGIYAQAIRCINNTPAVKVAIDIPSGLFPDKAVAVDATVVRAHHTVSFQLPKTCFMLPQSQQYVGEWHLVDIGLNKSFIKELTTTTYFLSRRGVRKLLKTRSKFDHKGTFGHALLVAGSFGKVGAAVLSARALLRSGVGLLTVHVPKCAYEILQTSVPEAMVQVDPAQEWITQINDTSAYQAIGVGPGLGQHTDSVKMLRLLMENFNRPMVFDADALNILSANRELLHLVSKGSILTPHPGEFKRLVGEWKNDFERIEKQKDLSVQLGAVVIVKGGYTTIACSDGEIHFNSTGNPGMATGGTGDVLTGILTGFLAQGYTAPQASVLGVYLHGLAGDLAAREIGQESLVAGDVIRFLPAAFRQLRH